MNPSFGDRLEAAFGRFGQLCVGIDPHGFLLRDWDLTDDAAGAREFALRVVDAAAGTVGVVKPQVAFFERFGSAGYVVLEEVIASARAQDLLVIADAKRGDVGSTVEAYAQAWLGEGSSLESDAMTISAFQGVGSLAAALALAERRGKGLFVLAATSNPDGTAAQQATIRSGTRTGLSVAAGIVADVVEWNQDQVGPGKGAPGRFGSVGVVLGATLELSDFGIRLSSLASSPSAPVLAPGFGHQGVALDAVEKTYGVAAGQVIVTASRSIASAGARGVGDEIARHAREVGRWRG